MLYLTNPSFFIRSLINLHDGFAVLRVYDPSKPFKPIDFTIIDLDSFLALFTREAKLKLVDRGEALCNSWNAEFENELPVSYL